MKPSPALIVLASGRAQRPGAAVTPLLQAFGRQTVLATTLGHAIETRWPVVVVTTARLAPLVAPLIATRDLVVLDDEALARGVGHAIAAGAAVRADAGGWLVLPADMPLVRPGSMRAVGEALAEHPVTYAQHRGRRGHPVGFGAELLSELLELNGDEGARRLVARYPAAGVEVDDPGVLMDVDSADDLAAARAVASAG